MRHTSATKRRLLTMAGLGLTATLALTGCQVEQGAAVFVGDERIDEEVVDSYIDEHLQARGFDLAEQGHADFSEERQSLVAAVTWVELGRQMGLDSEGILTPAWSDPGTIEQLFTEESVYRGQIVSALLEDHIPDQITDEHLQSVQNDLTEHGLHGEINPEYQHLPLLVALSLASEDLSEQVGDYDIKINPRYGDVRLELLPEEILAESPELAGLYVLEF
ncbi:hypothetical protein [Natronoglycomyces albus]|uniref:Uncharacterized protein n=1 Tax=Natronoglycomyces albus TaxID=2811108 RepID=A0A895XFF7_9ACTN|nr:hypothetical protein [Natronoglycomyces albus]QSB04581.1 hypothetical protein JQS30_12475 [Natronoglycomyces albus]